MSKPMSIPVNRLKSILESILFLSEKPISVSKLAEVIEEAPEDEICRALEEMKTEYSREAGGLELAQIAHGYQLRTKPINTPWIFKLHKAKPTRLSRAALETLSIVAYRQPVTRPEVDEIRGVDSGPVLRNMLERNLVRILGKREEPGQPLIYGTTKEFLEFFSLRSLSDLPTLREYTELGEESMATLEKLLPEGPSEETQISVTELELSSEPTTNEITSTDEPFPVEDTSRNSSEQTHEDTQEHTIK